MTIESLTFSKNNKLFIVMNKYGEHHIVFCSVLMKSAELSPPRQFANAMQKKQW